MNTTAGLFRRGLAFLIDAIVLTIFGYIVTWPFQAQLSQAGSMPFVFGVSIVLFYFTLSHTAYGSGQTLGKKILRIQVVCADGSYLSWQQSALRSLDMVFLWFYFDLFLLVAVHFPVLMNSSVYLLLSIPYVLIIFGYLIFLPIHPLKSGPHDFFAKTVVVKKNTYDRNALIENFKPQREKTAYLVTLGFLGICVIGGWFLQQVGPFAQNMKPITDLWQRLSETGPLDRVAVNQMEWHFPNQPVQKYLVVSGFLPKDEFDDEQTRAQAADLTAQLVKKSNFPLQTVDAIRVNVQTGFNMGIAKFSTGRQYDYKAIDK